LHTLLLLSSSSNRPLITLWTTSWCRSCAVVAPIVKDLIEEQGVGEAEGGLGYAEVDLYSSTIGDLGVKYAVSRHRRMIRWQDAERWLTEGTDHVHTHAHGFQSLGAAG
jgi:hypothetical protein